MKTTNLREQKTKKRRLDERKRTSQITKTQKELRKLFDSILSFRKKLETREYQIEFLTNPKYLYSSKVVLAGGTSSGKTEMTILRLEMFYQDKKNQGEKTIIIPASKNILKDNFTSRLEKFSPSFSYGTIDSEMSKEKIKKLLSPEGPQVIVCLPQLLKNNIDSIGEIYNFVLDEAQEWYFVGKDREFNGVVSDIINKCNPKHQLLLTGTPFIFNGKEEFEIFYVPAMELYEGGHISDVTVEIITSTLKFKNSDYTGPFGDLKTSVKFKKKSDEDSLEQVCKEILKKLKNPIKKNYTLNKITDNCLSVFNQLNKTIIFCDSIEQANHFYEKLQSFPGLSGKVCISHSKNDPDSEQFTLFEISDRIKVMIAVERGKIGYNLPELYNIVDFTYSQNLTLLLQMLGRLFRKAPGEKKQDKIYYKVSPKGNSSYFEDIMSAVWCLTHREWYEKFDLKNMGEIKIPRMGGEKAKRSQEPKDKKPKQKNEKVNRISLSDLGFPQSMEFFKSVLHKDNDVFGTVSYTTLEEVRKSFYDIKFTEITQEIEEKIISLHLDGRKLTMDQIAEIVGCSSASVKIILRKNNLKSWIEERQNEMRGRILNEYNDSTFPSSAEISRRTSFNHITINKILKEEGLESWDNIKIREAKESVLKEYHNGKTPSVPQISKSTGLNNSRIHTILERCNLIPWEDQKSSNLENMVIAIYNNGEKLSNTQIASRIGTSPATVCSLLSSKKLESWETIEQRRREEEILSEYHNGKNLTNRKIAEKIKTSVATVKSVLSKNGLDSWTERGLFLQRKDYQIETYTKNLNNILKMLKEGKSMDKIARSFGFYRAHVLSEFLKEKNVIETRAGKTYFIG